MENVNKTASEMGMLPGTEMCDHVLRIRDVLVARFPLRQLLKEPLANTIQPCTRKADSRTIRAVTPQSDARDVLSVKKHQMRFPLFSIPPVCSAAVCKALCFGFSGLYSTVNGFST